MCLVISIKKRRECGVERVVMSAVRKVGTGLYSALYASVSVFNPVQGECVGEVGRGK